MCVACLNVSTQPCAHRWYQLIRPCHPATHLANCPEKIQLQGWESRLDSCPFCDTNSDVPVHESTHRLFGTTSSASSGSSIASSSNQSSGEAMSPRLASPTVSSPLSGALARHGSTSSVESERSRGQRHREMNERLAIYLTTAPHDVLPSARKNYPTYSQLPPPALSALSTGLAGSGNVTEFDSDSVTGASLARGTRLLGRGWRKSVKLSRDTFPSFGSSG